MPTADLQSPRQKAPSQSATVVSWFLIAMPGGPGSRLVARICHSLQTLVPAARPAVRAATELARLMREHPSARFVVLIDNPVAAVARALQEGDLTSIAATLNAWREQAHSLLQPLQVAPLRCLCVDVSEAQAATGALATRLGAWLSLSAPLSELPEPDAQPAAAGALVSMLARATVQDSPQTLRLFDELIACCAVLSGNGSPALRPGSSQAVQDYQDLIERQRSTSQCVKALQAQLGGMQGERDAVRRDLAAAVAESNDLLGHLHQAQDQLEQYFERCQTYESVGAQDLAHATLQAARMQCLAMHEERPHRHRHYRLEQVQLQGRVTPALEVRLVEHAGRPGLALFKAPESAPPLSAWRATGREGASEFMLIIPADPQGRQLLQPMGTSDWALVSGLAALLQRSIDRADQSGTDWAAIADRLCRNLAALPPRLRYDRLTVEAAGAGAEHALRVRYQNALYGPAGFEELQLLWHTQTRGRRPLIWQLAGSAAGLPLSAWPAAETGAPLPDWPLPAGAPITAAEKRREWSSLTPGDRDFVLALLDALPAAALKSAEADLPSNTTLDSLVHQAAALHQDARRTLGSMAWRQALRHVLRRAGGNRT